MKLNLTVTQEELAPIFISHSGRDRELVADVIESFELYNRTASKKRPYIVITKDRLDQSRATLASGKEGD